MGIPSCSFFNFLWGWMWDRLDCGIDWIVDVDGASMCFVIIKPTNPNIH